MYYLNIVKEILPRKKKNLKINRKKLKKQRAAENFLGGAPFFFYRIYFTDNICNIYFKASLSSLHSPYEPYQKVAAEYRHESERQAHS